jgi:glycosyltransferase involved in cell wall biosynthesis
MKILIDTSAKYVTKAGMTTYIDGLLDGFSNLSMSYEIKEVFHVPLFDRKNRARRVIDTLYRDIIWTFYKLPKLKEVHESMLLHSPAILAPLRCKVPLVVTIHDLYVIRSPQSFSSWHSNLMKNTLPNIVQRADKIISISNFTKSEILNIYPEVPESKISVTLQGVNNRFKVLPKDMAEKVKHKFKLNKPYVLTVSTIEPRKNLPNLVKAFSNISFKIEHDLVIVGAYGWKNSELEEILSRLNDRSRIRFLGYVEPEDLPNLYNLAHVFVYPSLYEGFGMPPLEAMACGCAVITSDNSGLREVVDNSAIKIDPLNVEEIGEAILDVIRNESLRLQLINRGLERARRFTWESCARETLSVYESVIDKRRES